MSLDVAFLSLFARWSIGWYLAGRLPTLDRAVAATPSAIEPGRVSIIVPARNEASTLPTLLRTLGEQTHAPLEVIVVDDQSIDGTAAVAAAAGATVLRGGDLPAGWVGKPWACAQGAAVAAGDILVFLDADAGAAPTFLARLTRLVEAHGGLVSVAPYHRTERAYELASALFNLVAWMGIGSASLRRRSRVTGAFGPCLAMRTRDYAAIGGHTAVRGEVLEDLALSRAAQRHGLPVLNVAGTTHLRYRMYPAGPGQLIEGWSKNFAAGARATPALRVLAIVAWISALIEAGAGATIAIVTSLLGGSGHWWTLDLLFYALFALQLGVLLRRVGSFAPMAVMHPLAAAAFVGICARSVLLKVRGRVTWKGRTIVLDQLETRSE